MLLFLRIQDVVRQAEAGTPIDLDDLVTLCKETYPHAKLDASYNAARNVYLRHPEFGIFYEGFSVSDLHPGAVVQFRNVRFESAKKARKKAKDANAAPCSFRQRMWVLLDDPSSSKLASSLTLFMMFLIMLSTTTYCLETLPYFYEPETKTDSIWYMLEAICISLFTLEILLRLLTCPRVGSYFKETLNVIDVIAVLPFYVELLMHKVNIPGLAVFRVLRLVRVFRLFKMSRSSISIFVLTMKRSAKPLYMLVFFTSIATIIFSSLMYYLERGTYDDELGIWKRLYMYECPVRVTRQPPDQLTPENYPRSGIQEYPCVLQEREDNFTATFLCPYQYPKNGQCTHIYEQSPYESIPATFWWCLVTMTTVGYGDVVPVRWYGRLLGMIIMVFGILVIALPITVIGSNFASVYGEAMDKKEQEE